MKFGTASLICRLTSVCMKYFLTVWTFFFWRGLYRFEKRLGKFIQVINATRTWGIDSILSPSSWNFEYLKRPIFSELYLLSHFFVGFTCPMYDVPIFFFFDNTFFNEFLGFLLRKRQKLSRRAFLSELIKSFYEPMIEKFSDYTCNCEK